MPQPRVSISDSRRPRLGFVLATAVATLSFATPTLASPVVGSSASPPVDTTPVDTVPGSDDGIPPVVTNDFLDLERELSECISSNPPPGCGRKPTSPSDRGGWQQLLLFGILMTGMAVILGRVFVAVRRGERRS